MLSSELVSSRHPAGVLRGTCAAQRKGRSPSDSLLPDDGDRLDRCLLLCLWRLSLRSFLDLDLLLCLREESDRAMPWRRCCCQLSADPMLVTTLLTLPSICTPA